MEEILNGGEAELREATMEELEQWRLWVSEHADELEEKYPGHYLAIWDKEVIAASKDGTEAYRKAEEIRPDVNPLIVYIPREEERFLLV